MNSMTKMSEFWNSAWLDFGFNKWVVNFANLIYARLPVLTGVWRHSQSRKTCQMSKKKKNFQKVKGRDLFIHTACYSIQSNLVQHKVKHFQCLRSSFVWILHPNKRSKYSWWCYISRWIVMECLYLKVNLYQQFRQNIDINCWNAQLKV